MSSTRADKIFEELKKFWSPRSICQNVMVPQHDLLKSYGTTTRKLKIAPTVFVLLLQIYNSFPAPDFEQKKNPKSLTIF